MGRIAYLSKRGEIWWFRRRHPTIAVPAPQIVQNSTTEQTCKIKIQAKGHLAVSLKTKNSREARLLGARLSDHFENAWATFEAYEGDMTQQKDFPDAMANFIAKEFRQYMDGFASVGVSGMKPPMRQHVMGLLDAELRASLGIPTAPYGDLMTKIDPGIAYIVLKKPDPNLPLTADQEEIERLAAANAIDELSYVRTDPLAFVDFPYPEIDWKSDQGQEVKCQIQEPQEIAAKPKIKASSDFHNDGEPNSVPERYSSKTRMPISPRAGLESSSEPTLIENETFTPTTKSESVSKAFSVFAEEYLALRCVGYALRKEDETSDTKAGLAFKNSSLGNWKSSVKVFIGILGDLPLNEITRVQIVDFNEMIQRLPNNHGKSYIDKRSTRKLIEKIDGEEAKKISDLKDKLIKQGTSSIEIEDVIAKARIVRLSPRTIQRHQTAIKGILEHAFNLHLMPSNPFKGRIMTEAELNNRMKREARIQRTGWGDKIYTLLGSELFTKPLKDEGDILFWAPLIAMFAGLRLEEICQLRIKDFNTDHNIPYIAVQNELGSQLIKTNSSLRRVPLHRGLIAIGLPKLVELRQNQGHSRLFPELVRDKSKEKLGSNISKRFGYYTKSRGIKETGLDFHALRTEFNVRLTDKLVPEHTRIALMGHEQTKTINIKYYRAGYSIENLKNFVDMNDIEYSSIRRPFEILATVSPSAFSQ